MNNDDKRKPQQTGATNQYAYIWNYNAHVEHQHNYYGDKPEQKTEEYELIDLKFFDEFELLEQQAKLRKVLKGVLPRMDADSGRDWVAVYIAYHYYIGREYIMKGHSDFFADLEALLPRVLKKVNVGETGDKRYKAYTDLLRLECQNWFILNECLPPMSEWTSSKYMYRVDQTKRERIQQIVKDIYQGLKK